MIHLFIEYASDGIPLTLKRVDRVPEDAGGGYALVFEGPDEIPYDLSGVRREDLRAWLQAMDAVDKPKK